MILNVHITNMCDVTSQNGESSAVFLNLYLLIMNKTLVIKRADRDKRKTAPMFVVFATPVKGL